MAQVTTQGFNPFGDPDKNEQEITNQRFEIKRLQEKFKNLQRDQERKERKALYLIAEKLGIDINSL